MQRFLEPGSIMGGKHVRRGIAGVVGAILFVLSLTLGTTASASTLPDGAFTNVGCDVGNYSCYTAKVGALPYPYAYPFTAYAPAAAYGYVSPTYASPSGYQYTDSRFCGDGQVTATSQGYFCTTTGQLAYRSDGAVVSAPNIYNGYPVFPSGYSTQVVAYPGIVTYPVTYAK